MILLDDVVEVIDLASPREAPQLSVDFLPLVKRLKDG